jgi:Uncharacterized conserved protein, contains S4-like domain
MKEDKSKDIFHAKLFDLCDRARTRSVAQFTKFLNREEQADAEYTVGVQDGLQLRLFGGYETAERKLAAFIPDFLEADDTELFPICAVVAKGSGYRKFDHRDFLGSILALGITRELVGDIIVSKDKSSSNLILHESILDFVLLNFECVANDKISCKQIALSDLTETENEYEEIYDTVSSLRLDAVVCAATNLSREPAQQLICSGRVTVNHKEITQKDKPVIENDLISIRGKGRFVLHAVGTQNKKGRTGITIYRYR